MVLRFKSGKTLVVTVVEVVRLYVMAYDCEIVEQNGQLSLDFSA